MTVTGQKRIRKRTSLDRQHARTKGMMIGRYKTMTRRGGSVAVRAGSRQVDRMMELSGLYRIIEKLA